MRIRFAILLLAATLIAAPGLAQTPPAANAPAKPTTGSISAGLALTSGNKDTSTVNAGYELKYDPKTHNVVKSTGLVLYGQTDGETTAEQYAFTVRDEYAFTPRAFAFGELRYLHDRFKAISYLLSPTGGIGYKLVSGPATSLAVSAGAGGVWEKDRGVALQATGAVTFDEKFSRQLSKTASAGQTFSVLWKTSDFGDALYVVGVNVSAALMASAQLKIEVLDTFKAKPADPTLKRNDVALIMGVVYKF
jgi:putative salt-induced outer membrane protein YdiY